MTDTTIAAVYSDGGTIGKNPSPHGGAWAWCHVDAAGERIATGSGIIQPHDIGMPTVSNNLAEFAALLHALEALPAGWYGHVYCDNVVALGRFFEGWKITAIPAAYIKRGSLALQRLDVARIKTTLLDGHPTREHLAIGLGKRGRPVSKHNAWCDETCAGHADAWRNRTTYRPKP